MSEVKERLELHRKAMLEGVNTYLNALQQENRHADEIDVITEILKGTVYEHQEGQVLPNTPDICVHHFISKDEEHILQVSLEEAEKDTLEAIRQDEDDDSCGATNTEDIKEGNTDHKCVLQKGHEGGHRCCCDHTWE